MRKQTNMTNVKESGDFILVEEGEHLARIDEVQESITANGDDMLTIKLTMIAGISVDGWVWDNIVVSDNPNSPGYKILGRTKHFLHCIGEPYEGQIVVDTDNWKGKEVKIKVYHEPFTNKKTNKTITKAKVGAYLLDDELQTVGMEESPF